MVIIAELASAKIVYGVDRDSVGILQHLKFESVSLWGSDRMNVPWRITKCVHML
jgi:hypothetical protein